MHKDLVQGKIFKTLAAYSVPLIVTHVVQTLFNAVDVAVLSVMAGGDAVAAVGACGSIVAVLVNLCTGFATGANILIARRIGAKDEKGVKRATGTALVLGLCLGVGLMVVAVTFARQFLIWMQCQPDVLDQATVYMRIYFLGMPIIMTYNFVAAILRASGDSLHPMKYSLLAGVLNVGLNVFFVGVVGIEVEGVAIATVLSNLVSLILGLIALLKSKGICRVEKQYLRIRRQEFVKMFKIAVPASAGALCYYAANLFANSAVNSMGTEAMTANALSGQLDAFIYTVGNAIAAATMTMVGQN
ncbi:MAG: MATE family efflux transporter, partial [Clostridia bacterium]|nr:MATE family efflux transporter [Clostridia bacterium]